MLRSEALRVLGLDDDHDEESLRVAYKRAVMAAHPDRNGGVTGDITKLKKAKDFLAQRFAEPSSVPVCERCQGKGVIKGLSKFGTTCKACQGTGRDTRKR